VAALCLTDFEFATEYRTGEADLVGDFYRPCAERANRYHRAVGYFRSTVFAVAFDAIVGFAQRGGRIHLICSPQLSQDDIDAIQVRLDDLFLGALRPLPPRPAGLILCRRIRLSKAVSRFP
jgi:hypothetical protein